MNTICHPGGGLGSLMHIVRGAKKNWCINIGLEVHVQISCKEKVFSSSEYSYSDAPNTCLDGMDYAFPGFLPVLSSPCLHKAVQSAVALRGKVSSDITFDRKHYFYPDLPLGYQITQFFNPLMRDGSVDVYRADGTLFTVFLERMHLEQDAGKMIHDKHSMYSLIDYNRSGLPLMEIVTTPSIESPDDAQYFAQALKDVLVFIDVSSCDMEKGNMRFDANVSVREEGSNSLGTRCEIKNLNSFRFLHAAISYEVKRHINLYEEGEQVVQETRLYDEKESITVRMRQKEDAKSYRYIPDYNLPRIRLEQDIIQSSYKDVKYVPNFFLFFFQEKGLSFKQSYYLSHHRDLSKYFYEFCIQHEDYIQKAHKILLGSIFPLLNKCNLPIYSSPIDHKVLFLITSLLEKNEINNSDVKNILYDIFEASSKSPVEIINTYISLSKNKEAVTDEDIKEILYTFIERNKEVFVQKSSNEKRLLGWLMGQVMKEIKDKKFNGKDVAAMVLNFIKQSNIR